MMRPGRLGLMASGLLAATTATAADPPKLVDASPFGVRRGEAVEVTLTGANLGGAPRLIAPLDWQVEALPAERSKPEAWAFKLKVPASTALGMYPVRVQTDDGISNPLPFTVGQLPQVAEAEDNGRFDAAQKLEATPVVVEGRVAGNDVDYYRFAGKKGRRIVVDAQCSRIGSGVDPSIRLEMAAPSRKFIAAADDTPGLWTDARLVAELPEDGDYVVEISDSRYAGGTRPIYRLVIGEAPMAEEVFPLGGRLGETLAFELRGGTFNAVHSTIGKVEALPFTRVQPPRFEVGGLDVESLRPLTVSNVAELREAADPAAPPDRVAAPVILNGRIDPAGDEDRYIVAVKPGTKLRVQVDALKLGSALDGVLQALNSKGAVIATADDQVTTGAPRGGVPSKVVDHDPSAVIDVPADVDEVTLVLRDLEKRGGVGFPYRILVEPFTATPDVALDAAEVNIPRGGTAVVGATVVRNGENAPMTLTVVDPPAGLTVRPGHLAPGQTIGQLSISATADVKFPAVDLQVVAEVAGPNGPSRWTASRREVYASQEYLATNVQDRERLPAAPAAADVIAIDAPAGPVEVAHGQTATIPVTITRTAGADAAVDLNALPLSPGFTAAAVKVAEKGDKADFVVAVAPEAALGASTVGISAKGKFAPGDRTVVAPVVALNVVRPIELTLEKPSLELAPGATIEIKGKLTRKGTFKEPVVLKLDGLPAGVTVEAVTVAPDASDFVLKFTTAADAKAAEAASKVLAAFPIAGKEYPFPPSPMAVKVVVPPAK